MIVAWAASRIHHVDVSTRPWRTACGLWVPMSPSMVAGFLVPRAFPKAVACKRCEQRADTIEPP